MIWSYVCAVSLKPTESLSAWPRYTSKYTSEYSTILRYFTIHRPLSCPRQVCLFPAWLDLPPAIVNTLPPLISLRTWVAKVMLNGATKAEPRWREEGQPRWKQAILARDGWAADVSLNNAYNFTILAHAKYEGLFSGKLCNKYWVVLLVCLWEK